ncbi:MAG TPA: transposase [Gaiellaceae bacterium]|nr:transposase [Gaiellaceae bacterium]
MPYNVRAYDPNQLFLMPPSLRDWLPDGHLALFVEEVVDELDLGSLYARLRLDGRGGASYDPRLLLRVLLYAYATGERSSRRIERRLHEDVAYRVLAVNQHPDHATLARFRQHHQEAIAELFSQVLGLCVRGGLVDTGVVAIDGTKLKASASLFANKTGEELAHQILDEAARVDAEEDELFGDRRGDEIPEEWANPTGRRARIREALRQLEAEGARDYEGRMKERAEKEKALGRKLTGPEPTSTPARPRAARKANVTDPDSRIIARQSKGVIQGYNAQAAATERQIIVAAEITNTTNDQVNFAPMVKATHRNLDAAGHGKAVETFVADAGYWSAANANTETPAKLLIATRKGAWRRAPKPSDDRLAVLAQVNRGELSQRAAGAILGVSYTWIRDMTKRYFSQTGMRETTTQEPAPEEWIPIIRLVDRGEISQRAAADTLCVSAARIKSMLAHVRSESVDPSIALRDMDRRLAEPENARRYRRRQTAIEPVFGNIKGNLAYTGFMRRGRSAVQSEWRLICTTQNILKLWRSQPAS